MAGEILTWMLACVGENGFSAVPPKPDEIQVPMSELIAPCLLPGIDVVPIDPLTMDYVEEGVDFVESAQSKFITGVEDHMDVSYQELISGEKPFTVFAVHEDDHGNYKSSTGQVLAFTLGDYFAGEEEFPLKYTSEVIAHSPEVPPGGWLICSVGYYWSSCQEGDGGEYARRSLDYFAGAQAGSRKAGDLIGQNDYSGEYFAVIDSNSALCPEASSADWTVFDEVYNQGGAGTDGFSYSRDEFILTEAEARFEKHFDAIEARTQSLASVELSDAGGNVMDDMTYGAYYCENNTCYDVGFE